MQHVLSHPWENHCTQSIESPEKSWTEKNPVLHCLNPEFPKYVFVEQSSLYCQFGNDRCNSALNSRFADWEVACLMAELGLEPGKLVPGPLLLGNEEHSRPFVSYCLESKVPPLSNDRARTASQSCVPFTALWPRCLFLVNLVDCI